MSFQLINKNNRIYVSGGMSTEIGFAKYIAHRTNKVYAGWDINIRKVYPDMILDTLRNVTDQIRIVEPEGSTRTVLHSPGFLSVPYITELCNMIYLPSQFLVGFNSFTELHLMMQKLKISGVKAYAVAGFDGCIPHCLVAWIKFLEMPPQYNDLIQKYLHSTNVLMMGVYDEEGKTFGENVIYQYGNNQGHICEGDVYMLHIYSCYGQNTSQKDWEIFQKLAPDFQSAKMSNMSCKYVGDWESAFDIMSVKYYPTYDGLCQFAHATDTLPLYRLTYELSRMFMQHNNINIKGIVSNPYIMNTPTYEANFGYLGYTYWVGSSHIDNDLPELITRDLPKGSTIWFNDQNSQKAILKQELVKKFPNYKHVYINNSNPLCDELTNWIEKYKPTVYPQSNYVSLEQLSRAMEIVGVMYTPPPTLSSPSVVGACLHPMFPSTRIIQEDIIPNIPEYSFGQFNNWVIPGLVACGPFPGKDGINYTTDEEVIVNLNELRSAGIDTFVSLQWEISPQDGKIGEVRKRMKWAFPDFCNYSFYMRDDSDVKYLDFPIHDMTAPDVDQFRVNINLLLEELKSGRKLFIHCAGGHGRTGMYVAALIFLLEKCSLDQALERTQKRHDSRRILDKRQKRAVTSPSTDDQRKLVKEAMTTTPNFHFLQSTSTTGKNLPPWWYHIPHDEDCDCCACVKKDISLRDCNCDKCSTHQVKLWNKARSMFGPSIC